MKSRTRPKGEFTGRHMLFIMLAFFGTIIAVNLTMATLANRSWTGLVVKNTYVASQQFNEKAALAREQQALGWRGELTIADGTVSYRLTDRSGDPVPVEAVRMILRRPVSEQGDLTLELARAAHTRVAADTTVFGQPEGQRGIFVGGGGTVWAPRAIGYATMADLTLTGRLMNAREAHAAKVMQYVVPAGEERDRAIELAEKISGNTPLTNWQVTNLLPRINDLSHDAGLFMEYMNSNLAKPPETQERLRKFLAGKARLAVEGDGEEGR
jgi:nitrogen fixation protein FixH